MDQIADELNDVPRSIPIQTPGLASTGGRCFSFCEEYMVSSAPGGGVVALVEFAMAHLFIGGQRGRARASGKWAADRACDDEQTKIPWSAAGQEGAKGLETSCQTK